MSIGMVGRQSSFAASHEHIQRRPMLSHYHGDRQHYIHDNHDESYLLHRPLSWQSSDPDSDNKPEYPINGHMTNGQSGRSRSPTPEKENGHRDTLTTIREVESVDESNNINDNT